MLNRPPAAAAPRVRSSDRIAILLCTYNGERFLDEQLQSLANQTETEIDIVASDDGSQDGTRAILEEWRQRWQKGDFNIWSGPRAGFAENFRSLACRPGIEGKYVAFCDQDDIWLPDKLSTARAALASLPDGHSGLYCGRTWIMDEVGRRGHMSPLFNRGPSLPNALVQNIAGGNTMVMNSSAFAAFAESSRRTGFVSHDWWAYILVSGIGGTVIYDPEPHIFYRQHRNNVVGENLGWRARIRRLAMLKEGRFARWTDQNVAAIQSCHDLFTPSARETLATLLDARNGRAPWKLEAAGIYRQTLLGNLGLYAAILLGWL